MYLQAAAHYQRALQIDATNSVARSEAALVESMRANIESGKAVLDTDPRQALWYADVAARQVTPVLEPAAMLRCKVRLSHLACSGIVARFGTLHPAVRTDQKQAG